VRNTTHELIGVSLALTAGQALHAGPLETAGLSVAAVAGARLPDVDQLGARVHTPSRLERRSLIIGGVGAALRLPLVAFAGVVSHRALTHSAVACGAATALAALIASPAGPDAALVVGCGVALGYSSHVAADACTPGGVSLWAPLSRRRVWLLPSRARIPTGGVREALVAGTAGLGALALVLFS
jgi:inner membrane protein